MTWESFRIFMDIFVIVFVSKKLILLFNVFREIAITTETIKTSKKLIFLLVDFCFSA